MLQVDPFEFELLLELRSTATSRLWIYWSSSAPDGRGTWTSAYVSSQTEGLVEQVFSWICGVCSASCDFTVCDGWRKECSSFSCTSSIRSIRPDFSAINPRRPAVPQTTSKSKNLSWLKIVLWLLKKDLPLVFIYVTGCFFYVRGFYSRLFPIVCWLDDNHIENKRSNTPSLVLNIVGAECYCLFLFLSCSLKSVPFIDEVSVSF